MASHCEEDPSSPLLARSLPTSPPSASSSPSKTGVDSVISALQPWLQSMKGRALGAFAFPAERVWLRAIIKGWRHITSAATEARASARGGGHTVQDRVAEVLGEALEVLQSFTASPSTTAASLIIRLRRLHNEVGEMWTEHLKTEADASRREGREKQHSPAAAAVGTDESSVTFFHRCLRDLVAQQIQAYADRAGRRQRSPSSLGAVELAELKVAIAHDISFRRLRGALSFAAAVWGCAYDRTEQLVFQTSVKRVLSVLFTLDSITHAIPNKVQREEDAFRIQEFSILEEVPLPLVEALQQLGPL